MRKLLVILDDDLDKRLAKCVNQNAVVRAALDLYLRDMTDDVTLDGIRASYQLLAKKVQSMDSKIDYIAKAVS